MSDSSSQSPHPPHVTEPHPPSECAGRGVYRLPWIGPKGERYLAAVDRWGRALYQTTVYDNAHVRAAEVAMWEMLETVDSAPALELLG